MMSNPEYNKVQVSIEVPKNNTDELIRDIPILVQRIGGKMIDLSVTTAEIGPIKEPIIEYQIEDTYPAVEINAFKRFAIEEANLSKIWSVRLWSSLSEALNPKSREPVDRTWIDMRLIRERIRAMERGERVFWGLGQKTWDTVVTLNNQHEPSTEDKILPWNEDIHRYLLYNTSSKSLKRLNAIQELANLYLDNL